MHGEDEDFRVRQPRPDMARGLDAVEEWQGIIENCDIRRGRERLFDRRAPIADFGNDFPARLSLKNGAQT